MAETSLRLNNDDLFLFNEGTHYHLFEKLGAHLHEQDGKQGVHFAVWAPDADGVSVIGDFNGWDTTQNPLKPQQSSGVWSGFIPGLGKGQIYKYHVSSRYNGYKVQKADPFALHAETPPKTGSIVWDLDYQWNDADWISRRAEGDKRAKPMAIYEAHLESWRRNPDQGMRSLSYRELADELPAYLEELNFNYVELTPIMEYPFSGSWGYQTTGYFAPSSRFGTPQDFMYLIDKLHERGIGVILDWVPSHFPGDEHGLAYFDGTRLYEHQHEQKGFHPDWKSWIFNYGRHEVLSFLISSAIFWLEKYHIDGLRVDAVASMLYLDYSRKDGEWIPNEFGGNENLEAIHFMRTLNQEVYSRYPGVETIAEESTAWPAVSRPTYVGGLGFGFKWDMGWMHDMLTYMKKEPIHRKFHHYDLTFRMLYAWHENFVLSLSHDEVAHGKASLLSKMPGNYWEKFANLRLLYGYMYTQPGKKLLFMGAEFGQWNEWNHEGSLDWNLLDYESHQGMKRWMSDLNKFYVNEPALYETDCDSAGFEWVDCNDWEMSVISYARFNKGFDSCVVCVFNFTPVPRENYRIGLPLDGFWSEALNSDSASYYGGNIGNMGGKQAEKIEHHGRPYSAQVVLPPLSAVVLKHEG